MTKEIRLVDFNKKGGKPMYDELLKKVEGWVKNTTSWGNLASYLDLIIKIKTIQALDTSADLIRASRQVGRN